MALSAVLGRQGGDDLLFATGDRAEDRRRQRRASAGELQRVAAGVYTLAGDDVYVAGILQRNWQRLAAHVAPGAVVSHLSAMLGGITPQNNVILSHPTRYNRKAPFPGLTFVLLKGPGPLPGDFRLGANDLYWASRERFLLENLARGSTQTRAGRERVEEKLIAYLAANKAEGLNEIRDKARELAPLLGAEASFEQLNDIIGALLSTHSSGALRTRAGELVAAETPADPARLELFETLAAHLRVTALPDIADVAPAGTSRVNFTFLESYFSNFVEGTRFSVEEAEDIVLHDRILQARPKDSHDILGVFRLANGSVSRSAIPPPADEFVEGLQARHRDMLSRRPEARPGELKLEFNYAGTTQFVAPEQVRGTLAEGSRLALSVPEGLARAVYYLFLVSEVHPFDDDNGRLARLTMNVELSRMGRCRVIVPTLFHPQFVDCLRVLTRNGTAEPFVEAISRMARWCAQFDYSDLTELIKAFRACNAFEESPAQYRLKNLDASQAA